MWVPEAEHDKNKFSPATTAINANYGFILLLEAKVGLGVE
jgi:hypothetical protein